MDRHLLIAVSVLLGFGGTAGMITMYYIIGVIGKKYNSSFYIRSSILAVGMFGGVSGVILGNYISGSNTSKISLIFTIAASGIIILMLSLIPYSSRLHKDQSWMNDAGKSEVSNGNRAADGDGGIHDFSGYGLSKRETEVCTLLLQSYTLRQISAILSISYNTVNTYCTSLYRKLGINSRSELFLLFLVKEKNL
ncbi:MAG: helix-turn-helix transcriptional regulator, partial [Eubacteriales bacterium]|nr:helix-turn-helix transcriptional regulator [Eubacteriales bacterium]